MSEKKGLIIAIDGPAASGKSTTARLVAHRLGYTYIDTGAMYRAVTLAVQRERVSPDRDDEVERLARRVDIRFIPDEEGGNRTLLNGDDVSREIRHPDVSAGVSRVAAIRGVRQALVEMQRGMGREGSVVLDGRDIGTVVFPDADLKVFLVADIEERARRRLRDLESSGIDADVDRVAVDLEERDRKDSTRDESPLQIADDAVRIDTSGLSIDEQVEQVTALAREIERTQRVVDDSESDAESGKNLLNKESGNGA